MLKEHIDSEDIRVTEVSPSVTDVPRVTATAPETIPSNIANAKETRQANDEDEMEAGASINEDELGDYELTLQDIKYIRATQFEAAGFPYNVKALMTHLTQKISKTYFAVS